MHSAMYIDESRTCLICFSQEEFASSGYRQRKTRITIQALLFLGMN